VFLILYFKVKALSKKKTNLDSVVRVYPESKTYFV